MVIPTGNSLYTYIATDKILNWNGTPVTEKIPESEWHCSGNNT